MGSQIYPRYVPAKENLHDSSTLNGLRDIPPATPAPAAAPALPTPLNQHRSTKTDASATYTRYIPPPSKTRNRLANFEITGAANTPTIAKRKHETKENEKLEQPPLKKSKKKDYPTLLPIATQPVSEIVTEEISELSKEIKSQKKQDKKRKKKNEVDQKFGGDAQVDGDTNEHGDSRYKKPPNDRDSSSKKASTSRKKEKEERKTKIRHDRNVDGLQQMDDAGEDKDARHKKLLSKRENSLNKAAKLAKRAAEGTEDGEDNTTETIPTEKPTNLHPLEPLPQPEPVPKAEGKSTFSALPSWLEFPIRVSTTATTPFAELGLRREVIDVLRTKGFEEAFAVQAAVLPLLLARSQQQLGDILVSAATGSGKTLAYVLPMIESISQFTVRRLRGLIIMPTRELVTQAREVCEICATAFAASGRKRIKIGLAVGSQQLKAEQASIMNKEQRYDPGEYLKQDYLANTKWESSSQESDGEDFNLYDEETAATLPNHIIEYMSSVDILICTPGRLVEHMKSTPGFTLDYINWLIIDEADKLLDQSFQQWLEVVMSSLGQQAKTPHLQKGSGRNMSNVTKVILSATVTRDLGQLSALKLHCPKLVVLEGVEHLNSEVVDARSNANYSLPNSLHESAAKVQNEGEKPLYLLKLLKDKMGIEHLAAQPRLTQSDDDTSSGSLSSSSEEQSSDDERQTSSSLSKESEASSSSSVLQKHTKPPSKDILASSRGILIFTKSNETAIRLSRLLALLYPSFTDIVGILTSTIRNSVRKATLREFNRGKLSILVASDLASRGLDIPHLENVVNYDIPTSLTSYIHRVGRTARAGREGYAWTLYSKTEARWFWNEIARNELVQRVAGKRVERVNIDPKTFSEDERILYKEALTQLGKEASEPRSGISKKQKLIK